MISVVCVYNNKQIYTDFLLKSLKSQTSEFELIGIDNTSNEFKSAAEALNYGGKKARNKYIMFAHQDISFLANNWLEETERLLDSINNLGIAGVAGMSESGTSNLERGRNTITHGVPSEVWTWSNKIQSPEPIQTLDECLVIIPKSTFEILKFDEETCNGWHLYAVDYCLSIKELDLEAFVLPMEIYHMGGGTIKPKKYSKLIGPLPDEYYNILDRIIKKHKSKYKKIFTTCGDWSTSYPAIFQRNYYIQGFIAHLEKIFKR